MRRGLVGLAAVALLTATAGCKGDTAPARSTTTTPSTTTSTSITTTTTPALAPSGCDAATLTRVTPLRDRTVYDVDATLDLNASQVTGTMRARFAPDRGTDQIVLRLWANGPTQARAGAHEDIANVTVDDETVRFRMDNPTTAVIESGELAAGAPITLALSFTLRLPGVSDDRLSRSGTTVRLGSWLPLLAWEPIGYGGAGGAWDLDPPTTSNAEASVSVASDFTVHLVTPPGLTVLATGMPDGESHWTARGAPDWAASIGDFVLAQGNADEVPVTVGVERSIHESPNAYLARVIASLNELAARYGAYPWPAYTLAITPSLKGGIEYPGHVMQGPGTNARTTPHEAAHQWFYALVGNDQGRDPWLDEGLASWAEAQVNHTYASFLSKSVPAEGRGHLGEPMTYWDPRHGIYYRSVYVQGVQALGALGVSVAAVDCALARYVAANAYRVASPASLVAALKTVAPNAASVLARFGAQRLS